MFSLVVIGPYQHNALYSKIVDIFQEYTLKLSVLVGRFVVFVNIYNFGLLRYFNHFFKC